MTKTVMFLLVALIIGMDKLPSQAADKCIYYATLEKDQYGAISLDALDELLFAQRDGDKNKENELVNNNKIKHLSTDKKICVISESFYKNSSRISIPGYPIKYWVDSRKLLKIE